MKIKHLCPALAAAVLTLFAGSCDDEISGIGNSIAQGTLIIHQDTLHLEMPSYSVPVSAVDSRSTTQLLGRLTSDDFGDFNSTFVSRLMAAGSLAYPDSLGPERIDSVKMILSMPRGKFTGDSVAPQQLSVYRLTKPLPDNILSDFNPAGYYSSASLLGRRSYTLSEILPTDTTYRRDAPVRVRIPLPLSFGKEIYDSYKTSPEIFAWPETFNRFFPGIYVERSFGSGCVANVSKVELMIYFHYLVNRTTLEDGQSVTRQVHQRDSVSPFATAPEVLGSTNISFSISPKIRAMVESGQTLIISPAGYNARFVFPARTIVDSYADQGSSLAVVSALTFSIPAYEVANDLGIAPPPQLLMVKTSEAATFFSEGKRPDNKTSFWATYNAEKGIYQFDNLREYILPMLQSGEVDTDTDFTLIPATITTESYYQNGKEQTLVTSCVPYIEKPTMVRLDTSAGVICFTYSIQELK